MRRDWQRRLQRVEDAAASLPGDGLPFVVVYRLEDGYTFHAPEGARYDWAGKDTWPAWDDGRHFESLDAAQGHLASCGVQTKAIVTVEYSTPPSGAPSRS